MVDSVLKHVGKGLFDSESRRPLSREIKILFGGLAVAIIIGLAVDWFLGGHVEEPYLWYGGAILAVCVAAFAIVFGRLGDWRAAARKERMISRVEFRREKRDL